jgi:hypothetical protein
VGQPGDVLPEVTAVLYRASGVIGNIVNADGTPFEGTAWITISHTDEIKDSPWFTTNTDGFFEEQCIPAGGIALSVSAIFSGASGDLRTQTWNFGSIDAIAGGAIDLGELVLDPAQAVDYQE